MQLTSQLLLLSSATAVAASKHHLFVGAYSTPALFSLEYDTIANTLRSTNRFQAHSGHPWLSFSHDKRTLYGAEKDGWASYSVDNSQSVRFQSNLTLTSSCPNDKGDPLHGRTSVLAEARPPYNVFGSAKRACGTVISTKPDGSLDQVLQNINYGANSRIHGMISDPNSDYVYSADEKGNGIWVHQIEPSTGALVPLAFQPFPVANASPRRLALSASSRYLYVLLSKLTAVGVYEVNGPELRYTGVNYTIVPEGANPKFYQGHDILLSADKDIIYASARYRSSYNPIEDTDASYDEQDEDINDKDEGDDEQRRRYVHDNLRDRHLQLAEKFENKFANDSKVNPIRRAKAAGTPPGYVTAIQLMTADPEPSDASYGYVSAGWPIDVILQVPTSTSGGKSNALVPAPWGNEYFAVTDSDKGFVQIWKITGLQSLIRSKVTVLPKNMPGWNLRKRQDPNANGGPFLNDLLKPAAGGPPDGVYQPAGQGQTDPNAQPQQFQPNGPSQDPNAPQYVYPSPDPNAPPQPQGQDPNQQQGNNGLTIVVQAPPQQQQPPYDPYQQQPPPGSSYQPVFGGSPQPDYSQPQYPPQQNYPPPSYQAPPPAPAPAPAPAPVRPDPEDVESDDDDQQDYYQAKSGRPGYLNVAPPRLGGINAAPAPVAVAAPADPRAAGLLTGLLGGLLGGQKSAPGLADGLLGTNGGHGLLGGGGLLGLGILKKRDNVNVFSTEFLQAKAMVRASVIAEWRAPADVVARPNEDDVEARKKAHKQKYVAVGKRMSAVERRQYRDASDFENFGNPEDEEIDLDEYEGDGLRTTNPASRLPRVKTYNSAIPAGRGCCANAVWFD